MTLNELKKYSKGIFRIAENYAKKDYPSIGYVDYCETHIFYLFNFGQTDEGHRYWHDLNSVKSQTEFDSWVKHYHS